jgi:hypothetical protein
LRAEGETRTANAPLIQMQVALAVLLLRPSMFCQTLTASSYNPALLNISHTKGVAFAPSTLQSRLSLLLSAFCPLLSAAFSSDSLQPTHLLWCYPYSYYDSEPRTHARYTLFFPQFFSTQCCVPFNAKSSSHTP